MDGVRNLCPAELIKDGDLILLIERILELRERDTVRVTKVQGYADEGVVQAGQVRELGRIGKNAADGTADFGRRRVGFAVIDARRNLSGICGRWYPIIVSLHRFFIAVSRAVVNHVDGEGSSPDPLVWSAGALPKRRRLVLAVRDRAMLPGPAFIWTSAWVILPPLLQMRMLGFGLTQLASWLSGSLSWEPCIGRLIGQIFGLVVFLVLRRERLVLEKASPGYQRPGRPSSVSAVSSGAGIDIWRTCRFIGASMKSLCSLPGGIGRFVPCIIGANHWRLRRLPRKLS